MNITYLLFIIFTDFSSCSKQEGKQELLCCNVYFLSSDDFHRRRTQTELDSSQAQLLTLGYTHGRPPSGL